MRLHLHNFRPQVWMLDIYPNALLSYLILVLLTVLLLTPSFTLFLFATELFSLWLAFLRSHLGLTLIWGPIVYGEAFWN